MTRWAVLPLVLDPDTVADLDYSKLPKFVDVAVQLFSAPDLNRQGCELELGPHDFTKRRNSGLRFSLNARTPSFDSSVP